MQSTPDRHPLQLPKVARGPWNLVVWILTFAAALTLLAVAAAVGAAISQVPIPAAVILAALQAGALPLALRSPVLGAVLALVAGSALSALGSPAAPGPWPVPAATIIAFTLTWVIVGYRSRWFVVLPAWALALLPGAIITARATQLPPLGTVVADLIVFAAVSLVGAFVGILIRRWNDVRTELSVARATTATELARREAAEEKARIARELHDVVAHGMSAIQVRAASARYRYPELAPEVGAEFDDLAVAAREAMREMRGILGVLREEGVNEHAPQPTLADIDTLIERSLHPVHLDGAWRLTDAERDDPLLGLTVYRVVQEALSNVARHAPGAATTITWTDSLDALALEIRNAAPSSAASHVDRGGQGLRGMRERVAAIGGSLDTGPTTDGGFAVRVYLPRTTSDRRKRR